VYIEKVFTSGGESSFHRRRPGETLDLRERRELNNGFGEALARAFELALTPAIFAGLGWLLDGALGTRPVFTLVLFVLVAVYMIWKMLRGYDREMQVKERELLGERRTKGAGDGS
jgi:hypothetical protein